MRLSIVLVMTLLGVVLGGIAIAAAQDGTPTSSVAGTPCPSPDASPQASIEATPDAAASVVPAERLGCGTPEAGTPGVDAGGDEGAAAIANFAFDPATIEVAAGETVTWTNRDGVPHTATGLDRDALQSGAIAPGTTFSQTFEGAGSYDYFCEFHAGMRGTVVVR